MNSTQAKTSTSKSLLPFPVIVSAAGGDADAINYVLKHYAGYIAVLSMRTLYDEYGNPHLCIDDELRRRLETKLITNITKFRIAYPPPVTRVSFPFRASCNGLFVIPSKRIFKECFDRLINADCSLTKKAPCGRISKQTHSVRAELYGKCAKIPYKVERETFLP